MPEGGCLGEEEWISGQVSDHCPVMDVAEHDIVFQSYIWAKRGFLPNEWLHQPAYLMDGIDTVWAEVEAEEVRRAQADN